MLTENTIDRNLTPADGAVAPAAPPTWLQAWPELGGLIHRLKLAAIEHAAPKLALAQMHIADVATAPIDNRDDASTLGLACVTAMESLGHIVAGAGKVARRHFRTSNDVCASAPLTAVGAAHTAATLLVELADLYACVANGGFE